MEDKSLTSNQIRFIELIIDQLSARGVIESGSLYEPPFNSLHEGGPDVLFSGNEKVIEGVFQTLETLKDDLTRNA
ncbi:MAG: type I restriction-modification enzyme R subunit C-terminal domain-containing protein [Puniceicoccaceae bacterium]